MMMKILSDTMFSPSLEEVIEIGKNEEYKRIPISYEINSSI